MEENGYASIITNSEAIEKECASSIVDPLLFDFGIFSTDEFIPYDTVMYDKEVTFETGMF